MTKPTSTVGKKFLGDVAIYGLGDALLRGISLIAIPVFTRLFSPTDYGIISILVAFMGFFGLLLDFGMASAAQRQYFDEPTDQEKIRATSTAFWFGLIWSLALISLSLPFYRFLGTWVLKDPNLGYLFWLILPASGIAVLAQLVRSYFRLRFNPWPFTVTAFVSGFGSLGLSVLFVAQGMGVFGYFLGVLLGAGSGLLLTLWLARNFIGWHLERTKLAVMVAFGLPLVPAALASFVFDLSDRFFLAHFHNLGEVGIYSVGVNLVNIMMLFIGAFAQAWSPFAFAQHTDNPAQARFLFGRFLVYILAIFSFLGLGLTVFSHEALAIFTTPEFFAAERVVPILSLSFIAFATTMITSLGISLARKTPLIAWATLLAAIVNSLLNVILIPPLGMLGAAWATLAAYLTLTTTYVLISARYQPFVWPWARAARIALLAIIFIFLAPALPDGLTVGTLGIKAGYIVLFVGSLFVLRVFEAHEIDFVRSIIRFDIRFWRNYGGAPKDPTQS